MTRDELPELHYITPIGNLSSILDLGILSHRRVRKIAHESVSLPEVQARRARIRVPGGLPLHDYANLYFTARNPMMYRRKEQHAQVCVLRVSTDVLDLRGVVITDQNAAADFTRFLPSPRGLASINSDEVYARDWRHPGSPTAYYRHRRRKCAEVLVPECIAASHVVGAIASCQATADSIITAASTLPVEVNGDLFFLMV